MIETLAGAAFMATAIRTFVAIAYVVPSESMRETLQVGDRILGERLSLRGRELAAGDIVTFDDPRGGKTTLVKRVVALAGQTVEVGEGRVLVDGVPEMGSYLRDTSTHALSGVTYPYVVPEGSVWVMGDNRGASSDSRAFGAIPLESVRSRIVAVYWPPQHARRL